MDAQVLLIMVCQELNLSGVNFTSDIGSLP